MVQRIGGKMRKSRYKMRKKVNARGKIPITKYLQKFNEGDKVQLNAESAVQKGIYSLNYHGKAGIVSKKEGTCYNVMIKDGKKEKCIIVHPVHLKRL
ncbi:MAG: 50S ribosomal protein L21e [Candidatus Woesearchaeota archaeon]